jgi:hypothetical protein
LGDREKTRTRKRFLDLLQREEAKASGFVERLGEARCLEVQQVGVQGYGLDLAVFFSSLANRVFASANDTDTKKKLLLAVPKQLYNHEHSSDRADPSKEDDHDRSRR